MNDKALVTQVLENPGAFPLIASTLSPSVANTIVDTLKQEADRNYWSNTNRSLELAEIIIQLGQARGDLRHEALGVMTRGDALKFLGDIAGAWEALGQAGELFERAGDPIGWARTRIGRVFIAVDLDRVAVALADADKARQILRSHGVYDKLLALDLNTAHVHNLLGDQRQALMIYQNALANAQELLEGGDGDADVLSTNIGLLLTNIGNVYDVLGDFRQALAYHQRARELFSVRNQQRGMALAEYNSAHILMQQGNHRQALQLLHRAEAMYVNAQLDRDVTNVRRDIVECYLLLNRYQEARQLARSVVERYHAEQVAFQEAFTLVHLAIAEAELGDVQAAQQALDTAEPIFTALGASNWSANTQLRRAQIAQHQGDFATAVLSAQTAAAVFAEQGQQVHFAAASLAASHALFAQGNRDEAQALAMQALLIARNCNVPPLRYSAHLLLGRIAEQSNQSNRAGRRYSAAIATVDRVQRGLTITLRPNFLEDKGEALRALMAQQIRAGRVAAAFQTLERAKSQALLGYIGNRDQLRWASTDETSHVLIAQLDKLRAEHQWFYRLAREEARGDNRQPDSISPEQARTELAHREREMRKISEQLYLQRESVGTEHIIAPTPAAIQATLHESELLIEFYSDGEQLWAFTFDQAHLELHHLSATHAEIDRLLGQLQINIAAALELGPESRSIAALKTLGQRILQRLYAALIAPLSAQLTGRRRLTIVPYGSLHYLPFHLLHDGKNHLVASHEIVILPAAALATRRNPARPAGARVLAHGWSGRLPRTQAEGHMVRQLCGGEVYWDRDARRSVLAQPPCQILHIAAHGEARLDQPDLSYIELADGQIYSDDLFQHDLSYELVTLSACETGRANVAAGDELIGLGRGFLYAGAGALIASLWPVGDEIAIGQMERFYTAITNQASKAAALREAQLDLHTRAPHLHPAFWGAFQLVGNADPLSVGQL